MTIAGGLGGFGEGTADVVKQNILSKAQAEREEANFYKERSLKQLGITSQEKIAADRISAESSENEKKITSAEKIAGMKSKGSAAARKVIKTTDDEGNEIFVRYDPETDSMTPVGMAGSEAGKLTYDDAADMANREYNDKASMFKSDASQFGMTEAEWKNKRIQELMSGDSASGAETPKPAAGGKTRGSKDDYIKAVIQANGGKDTPELRKQASEVWEQKYKPAESTSGGIISSAAASETPPAEKPAAKPEQAKPVETAETPEGKEARQRTEKEAKLKRLEDMLAADDKLKAGGTGGLATRSIKAGLAPLGLITRISYEKQIKKLRSELNK